MTASVSESSGGDVAAYDGGTAYSEYGASGGRRRGKRNSRRRSRKNMRKMYSGGEGELSITGKSTSENQGGGRRRKGKTQKGKTRKGKVSKWITHVKNFSKANKMDFRDALKDPKCKSTYHKMK